VSWSVIDDGIDQWRKVTQIFPCLHSSHWRTIWLFVVRYISQNVIDCNKLSKNLLLNEIFVSHWRLFLYFHKVV